MRIQAQRMGALALALSLIAAPMLTTGAEAGHRRYRGDRTRAYCPPPREYRVSCEAPRHRSHHRGRHHESGFWPFVGGLAVGAVIGSQYDQPVRCEVPRPVIRARIYIYDCDACDYRGVGYEAFCDHLVFEHHVSRCDVTRWYRPYANGYWEDQY